MINLEKLPKENNNFKKLLNEIAVKSGFESAFGGWFKESNECIAVLGLQKSNFGNNYYLNIKTYIQGIFGISYLKNSDLVKKDMGDILMRQPKDYDLIFDMDSLIDDNERKQKLEELFVDFVIPYSDKTLSLAGINELAKNEKIPLYPAVKKELERMSIR